jgi:hypothetical protein
MTISTESYRDRLLESQQEPEAAARYLLACLENEDPCVFLLALRDVADATRGSRKAPRSTKRERHRVPEHEGDQRRALASACVRNCRRHRTRSGSARRLRLVHCFGVLFGQRSCALLPSD